MKVLLTGAGGFVGSHVLRHLLMETDWEIFCPYTFQHKGLSGRIESSVCDDPAWMARVTMAHWDMRVPADHFLLQTLRIHGCDVIMNVASESHVDRSIAHPAGFIADNTALMLCVLELARELRPQLFLQMSTDEVYGPAHGDYRHKEWDVIAPSNPYSASKAAQEAIAFSYWRTYGVPVVITNTMNIIGEMQDPEKFLPKIIRNLRDGTPVTVHCSPDGTPGSRFYLHARNLADAWVWLTRKYTYDSDAPARVDTQGPAKYASGAFRPDRFNIVGEREIDNIELVQMVGRLMGMRDEYVLGLIKPVSFHESRPGHDLRYALDGSRLESLGWRAPRSLEESLGKTVEWTLAHPEWLD